MSSVSSPATNQPNITDLSDCRPFKLLDTPNAASRTIYQFGLHVLSGACGSEATRILPLILETCEPQQFADALLSVAPRDLVERKSATMRLISTHESKVSHQWVILITATVEHR